MDFPHWFQRCSGCVAALGRVRRVGGHDHRLAVPRGKLYHSIRKRKVETGSAGLARIGK